MKKLSCPVRMGKKCEFLEFSPTQPSEVESSVDFISETFPHMKIPRFFWKTKLEKDMSFLLKENGKDIIGMLNMRRKFPKTASLDLLAVRDDQQGKGIGTLLLKQAETIASDLGDKKIQLMTEQKKTQNVAFYSKNKYKIKNIIM